MTERKLSELQKAYRVFFLEKMKLYGVKSPAELTRQRKSEFFTEIKQGWATYKLSRKKDTENFERTVQDLEEGELREVEKPKATRRTEIVARHEVQEHRPLTFTKQVIRSLPNKDQTDDLKILFEPNTHFSQEGRYLYPVVKMPKPNSSLKLPRDGRSNQKGYKENDLFNELRRQNLVGIEVINNVHMVIPNFNRPYEPDIVLFDKRLNLYIDLEIDEPYDGYFRYPTHCIHPEDEVNGGTVKQDDVRDLFFTESGWVVIRFTEKQVHCQVSECIQHIRNVLNSIYNQSFTKEITCEREEQWNYNQCIQWQKFYYRERYLGIDRFQKQYSYKEIEISSDEIESIENVIQRTKKFSSDQWNTSIAFDEESHRYRHPKDSTGNAEYLSVTTLIERFFPFDLKRYIERKAEEENRTEDDVFDEYVTIRDEAAERGTFLHIQIENFLKGNEFDSSSKEFKLFIDFYNNEIRTRDLEIFDTERMICSSRHKVAGTIDCLFKKKSIDEYIMIDWKRSRKLIIDGRPRIFGYGYALSELNALDNSSYNRYCLQQNIYKYIVETECSMKISSMKLVVLHEDYPGYYLVPVPEMKKETKIILNSLNTKI